MQGIAILANECLESYAGASKKRVRRTMLIYIEPSKLSDRYIVQGIAILANECLESPKCCIV